MAMKTAPITITACSTLRCERERRVACAALAGAYAKESEIARRFDAMTRAGAASVAPVMADEGDRRAHLPRSGRGAGGGVGRVSASMGREALNLAGVREADVVLCDVGGYESHARVWAAGRRRLEVEPLANGVSYRTVTARQVLAHQRRSRRSRGPFKRGRHST